MTHRHRHRITEPLFSQLRLHFLLFTRASIFTHLTFQDVFGTAHACFSFNTITHGTSIELKKLTASRYSYKQWHCSICQKKLKRTQVAPKYALPALISFSGTHMSFSLSWGNSSLWYDNFKAYGFRTTWHPTIVGKLSLQVKSVCWCWP